MAAPFPPELQQWIDREDEKLEEAGSSLPFAKEEYAARLRRLQAAMRRDGVDVLLLTSPDSMGWLHGFSARVYGWHSSTAFPPHTATVVHCEHDTMFYIDSGFHAALVKRTSCIEDFRPIVDTGMSSYATMDSFNTTVVGEMRAEGWGDCVVGVERWSGVPSPVVAEATRDALQEAGHEVVDATSTIRGVRRVKSSNEIAYMEQAQAACDAGLTAIHRNGWPGMTELQAWNLYMGAVIESGGEPSAIHETVGTGPPHAALHGLSSRRRIVPGDYFHPDMSAAVHRYHARTTRPFSMGRPAPEVVRISEIVAGAHDVVLETAAVGMTFGELAASLNDYFRGEGIDGGEGFGGGYELGLSFNPQFVGELVWGSHRPEDDRVIEDGFVSNFESVAFLTMIDTVLFEASGARFLSGVPRELMVIDA